MYVTLVSPYCPAWVLREDDPYLQDHPSMYTLVSKHATESQAQQEADALNSQEEA